MFGIVSTATIAVAVVNSLLSKILKPKGNNCCNLRRDYKLELVIIYAIAIAVEHVNQ